MGTIKDLISVLPDYLPVLLVLAVSVGILRLADWMLRRRANLANSGSFSRQIIMLGVSALALIVVLLALPVDSETRGQLFSLLGLVLTAIIALSSTTVVANAMGGIMLRSVGSFRPGDFIKVGEQFGRVTDRGLFHTEIQTEERDLTTLPNLYLVSNPVTVVHESGTIISCSVSLGYDVHRKTVEPLLIRAAEAADLSDPFVQVLELGDFSVTYRVGAFLTDVKYLVTMRSNLREQVLDMLHGAGIEIASPTIMNQRPVSADSPFIPSLPVVEAGQAETATSVPEEIIFDKAEEAAATEKLRAELEAAAGELKEKESQLGSASGTQKEAIEQDIVERKRQIEALTLRIQETENGPATPEKRS